MISLINTLANLYYIEKHSGGRELVEGSFLFKFSLLLD